MPSAVPSLVSQSGATAIVDAADGQQPTMWLATKAAIDRARARPRRRRRPPQLSHRSCRPLRRVDCPRRHDWSGDGQRRTRGGAIWGPVASDGHEPDGVGRAQGFERAAHCLDVATAGVAEGKLRWPERKRISSARGKHCRSRRAANNGTGGLLRRWGAAAIRGAQRSGFSLIAQFIGRGLRKWTHRATTARAE